MEISYEAAVKARMVKKAPQERLGGLFRGGAYPHIFRQLKDNFIDGSFPAEKCLKGRLTDEKIKYHYAEHLNSSQTMCIAYFKKFFEGETREGLLLQILARMGLDVSSLGELTDAVLEHVPNGKEGTNFDFFLKFTGGQITWEIKFTEKEFGGVSGTVGGDTYREKYRRIYLPMLAQCAFPDPAEPCADSEEAMEAFFRHYQIRRNILYASSRADYVLFLTPRENPTLEDGRAYIERYAAGCGTDHIRNLYWEDLLETTLAVVCDVPELLSYYTRFREKYFG